ncbi:MAG: VWA domain-containing protein [Candidatus Heteroscillospira sp.]
MPAAFAENLTAFFSGLRERGLVIGPAEAADAVRIMENPLLHSREHTRLALRCLLAKTRREQEIFDEYFGSFFVAAAVHEERGKHESLEQLRREEIISELSYEGKPIELPDELREVYADMDAPKREKLKNYLGISTENRRRSPFTYKFMQRVLEQQLRMEDAMYEADDAGLGADASDLLYKDISKIGEDEMPRAVALIQKMVERLNGALSRAWRRSGKRGRLDFRATIRASLGSGGLYKLKYRRRRSARRRLVLLCDVSGSMLQYSEFAIRFIKSMAEVSDSSEVFIFSEELRQVRGAVLENMDDFQSHVKHSGLWGRGTDIAAAVNGLLEKRPCPLSAGTVFVIISDTKSVNLPEARRAVQQAARLAGRTIWLNPIPSRKWPKLSSVQSFSDLCAMLDCSTINDLSRACARSFI